jgi:very-short-patch-repair endonuclease
MKSINLFLSHPELAAEWHSEKNLGLTPYDVTTGSNKRVWWKCGVADDHIWDAQISQRSKGSGCPYCKGQKVVLSNCLATLYPKIAEGWYTKKNGTTTPISIAPTSKKKAWWTCENNHEYEVSIYSRVRSNGCKICNRKKHTDKGNATKLLSSKSLAKHSPQLLIEWDYEKNTSLDPNTTSYGSNEKVWWKCANSHEWEVSPKVRTRGSSCPICAIKKNANKRRITAVAEAGQSFAEAHPELLKEWDNDKNTLSPNEIAPKSGYRASWICKYNHKWEATVTNRTHNNSNCPECNPQSSRIEIYLLCELRAIYDNVKWRHKFDGVECDIFIPEINLGIEVDGGYWHDKKLDKDIKKGQFFKSLGMQFIRLREQGLPNIEGTVVEYTKTKNEQTTTNNLINEIAKICPSHSLLTYLRDGIQKCVTDFNEMIARLPAPPDGETLRDTHPKIAAQWCYEKNSPLTPDLFSKGSNQKFWWLCENGHHYDAAINNRVSRGSGCPHCYKNNASDIARNARLKKTQSLVQVKPVYLHMYDVDMNHLPPSEVAIKSNIDIWWKCEKSHSFQKKPTYMADNHDCPTCNSLPTKFPEVAEQWNYNKNPSLDPKDFHSGSHSKVWWKCSKGHEWKTTLSQRTLEGTGCPHCYNEKRGSIYRENAVKKYGSLAILNPDYLSEWDYDKNLNISPDGVTTKSPAKVWWKCKGGHSYNQAIASKARGSVCPACANIIRAESVRLSRLKKSGSLRDHYPIIAEHWHPLTNGELTPDFVTKGAKQKVWWVCEKGHEWNTTVNTMTDKRRSFICPECKNLKE